MANYADLKNAIAAVIRTNGNQEITGQLLQDALMAIIDNIGGLSGFAGVATPSTAPGSPDSNQFYVLSEPGTYSNFGGVEVEPNSIYVSTNQSGAWVSTRIFTIDTSEFVGEAELEGKMDRWEIISPGKNIFDKTKAIEGFTISTSGVVTPTSGRTLTGYMPISPLTAYVASVNSVAVVFYDSDLRFLSGIEGTRNFTSPAGAYYVRVSILTSQVDIAQFEEGNTSTTYEPFELNLSPSVNTPRQIVALDETEFINVGKNLFDLTAVEHGYRINASGVMAENPSFSTSDYIRIKTGVAYYKNESTPVAYFNADREFVSGANATTNFTPPFGAVYIRTAFSTNALTSAQIEEGSSGTAYEPFGSSLDRDVKIDGGNVKPKSLGSGEVAYNSLTVEEVDFVVTGKNLFDKDSENLIPETRISTANLLVPNVDYTTSDYIRVEPGVDYYKNGIGAISFYDERKIFTQGLSQTVPPTFTVPAGSYYMRTSFLTSDLGGTQIELGTVQTDYEPFQLRLKGAHDETGGDVDTLPDYALAELDRVREQVAALSLNQKNLNFAFCTDNHVNLFGNTLISELTLKRFANEKMIDCVVLGGDMHDNDGPEETGTDFQGAMDAIGTLMRVIGEIQIPVYSVVGNHDRNDKLGVENEVSKAQFYSLYLNRVRDSIQKNPLYPLDDYYFVDFEEERIRMVILNGFNRGGQTRNYGPEQIDWVENEALDFSGKSENDWQVIFFTHSYYTIPSEALFDVIHDFQNDGGVVIAFIAGHTHADSWTDEDGFNAIVTAASLNYSNQIGSINEICFDVFTVDRVNRIIYAHRVGRGSDRQFNY